MSNRHVAIMLSGMVLLLGLFLSAAGQSGKHKDCAPITDPITGKEHWSCLTDQVDIAHPELGVKCKLAYENRYGCNNNPQYRCHSVLTSGKWSCNCDNLP
jgi:hypothetical protein